MRTVLMLAALAFGTTGVADAAFAAEKPPKEKTNPKAKKPKQEPERDLKMNEGTAEAGGSVTLDLNIAGGTAVGVNVSPYVGYFVADRFELLLDVGFYTVSGASAYSFQGGGRVFADLGESWAYLGVLGGYGGGGVNAGGGLLTIPVGIIAPLAKNVGVDLGAAVNMGFSSGGTSVYIPIGYLGVSGFFHP